MVACGVMMACRVALVTLSLASLAAAMEMRHYDDSDAEAVERMRRRLDLPFEGEEDEEEYVIDEESSDCDWCGSSEENHDFEHRASTVFTETVMVDPGECVVTKSMQYPNLYPNNVDVRTTFRASSSGSDLTFDLPKGGLQKSYKCRKDKLVVFADNLRSTRCAGIRDFRRSTSSGQLYVRMLTNHRIRWHGYNATVCASVPPTTTTTTSTTTTTTTTTPAPVLCDDVCGDLGGYSRIATSTNQYPVPWVVTVDILRDNYYVRCSGTIISRKHVVTGAYCFWQGPQQGTDVVIRVTAGGFSLTFPDSNTQTLYTSTVAVYPTYNATESPHSYNMAILTLPDEGFTLTPRVAPLCVGNASIITELKVVNSNAKLSGWGWLSSGMVNVNTTTVDMRICGFGVPAYFMCIYTLGVASTPCWGDDGAAFYKQWSDGRYYALGYVPAITQSVCPLGGFLLPSTYAHFFLDWINGVTGPRFCTQ